MLFLCLKVNIDFLKGAEIHKNVECYFQLLTELNNLSAFLLISRYQINFKYIQESSPPALLPSSHTQLRGGGKKKKEKPSQCVFSQPHTDARFTIPPRFVIDIIESVARALLSLQAIVIATLSLPTTIRRTLPTRNIIAYYYSLHAGHS